jgi:hypothetical protein
MVSRFERRAGYWGSVRSPGREPVGKVRRTYAQVLGLMRLMIEAGRTENPYGVLVAALDEDRDC